MGVLRPSTCDDLARCHSGGGLLRRAGGRIRFAAGWAALLGLPLQGLRPFLLLSADTAVFVSAHVDLVWLDEGEHGGLPDLRLTATCHHLSMFQSIKDFFDTVLSPTAANDPGATEHALRLATAVMLVEVMRADASFRAREREAVLSALRERFSLSEDEASHLTELAVTTARDATDLFAFTSRLNEHFDMPQKLRMVEHMWRVAYADGHLSDHERHVLWRVADLLHVPQGAYVNARLRVQEEFKAIPGSEA